MSATRRHFLTQCGIAMGAALSAPGTAAALMNQSATAHYQPLAASSPSLPSSLRWIDREQVYGAQGWQTVAWRVDGTLLRIEGDRVWLQSMHAGDHWIQMSALDSAQAQYRISTACGPTVLEELCKARGVLLRR